MQKILILAAFFCFVVSGKIKSQSITYYDLIPTWSQTGTINKKTSYNVYISNIINVDQDAQTKLTNTPKNLEFYMQNSVHYKITPNTIVGGSYTFVNNNSFTDKSYNEHRVWQQVNFLSKKMGGLLNNRFRLEERFIGNSNNNDYNFSSRLRYQLGYTASLKGQLFERKHYYVNVSNEFFFTLTKNRVAFYSNNWSYAGIGFDFLKNTKLELGYLMLGAVRNQQKDLCCLHLGQATLITHF